MTKVLGAIIYPRATLPSPSRKGPRFQSRAARLYWENKGPFFSVRGVKIPAAVSVFPDELQQAPKSWSEQAYPKLVHYNRLPKGGHFAAWEQRGEPHMLPFNPAGRRIVDSLFGDHIGRGFVATAHRSSFATSRSNASP